MKLQPERKDPVAVLALAKWALQPPDGKVRAGPVERRREQNRPAIFPGPQPDCQESLLPALVLGLRRQRPVWRARLFWQPGLPFLPFLQPLPPPQPWQRLLPLLLQLPRPRDGQLLRPEQLLPPQPGQLPLEQLRLRPGGQLL